MIINYMSFMRSLLAAYQSARAEGKQKNKKKLEMSHAILQVTLLNSFFGHTCQMEVLSELE